MIGRGFSSCLFCESQHDLILGNELILRIVQKLYETEEFDIMLQNSKACLKCIGRFHQLNDFCDMICLDHIKNEGSDKKRCDICYLEFFDHELVPSTFEDKCIKEIERTSLLTKNNIENGKITICYSCNNFIVTFSDKKEELHRLLEFYISALNKCTVNLGKCVPDEDDPLFLKQNPSFEKREFLDSLSLTPVQSSPKIRNGSVRKIRFASRDETINIPSRNRKFQKSRRSIEANNSNTGDILKIYNIIPCTVVLERLNLATQKHTAVERRSSLNKAKPKPKLKIKLNAKAKVEQRKMKVTPTRRTTLNKTVTIGEEITIPEIEPTNCNIALTDTDPLTDDGSKQDSENIVQNGQENSSIEENNNSLEITGNAKMEDDTVKDSEKRLFENEGGSPRNDYVSPRKTRRSGLNLKAVTMDSEIATAPNGLLKRKPKQNNQRKSKFLKNRNSSRSKKKQSENETEQLELIYKSDENVMSDTSEDILKYLSPSYEIKELAIDNEESCLNESTEIVFLHPKYKNKAVTFDNNTTFEDLEYLSPSTNNEINDDLTNVNMEDNAEYLESDELIEDLLTNHSSQCINDFPIFTMDELRNEDSLINET